MASLSRNSLVNAMRGIVLSGVPCLTGRVSRRVRRDRVERHADELGVRPRLPSVRLERTAVRERAVVVRRRGAIEEILQEIAGQIEIVAVHLADYDVE